MAKRPPDKMVVDHMVVDALLMGAKAVSNLSDEDIANDYARQEKITPKRAKILRESALELIRPVVDAVAKRGYIDYDWPPRV